jgi:hypothetical protein
MMVNQLPTTVSDRLDQLEKRLKVIANESGRTKLVVHEIGGSMSWIGYERRKKIGFFGKIKPG